MKHLIPFIIVISAIFTGCSLKYDQTVTDDEEFPEFIFSNATFRRYENNKSSMVLNAGRLEQYKDGKSMYGKDISFSVFDDDGSLSTKGSCGYLAANTSTKKYALYSSIKIENLKEQMQLMADALKWNGKSEQLTSGKTDTVTIIKDKTTIRGSGFSASAVSKKYAFTGVVTGQFITDEEAESTNLQEETEEPFEDVPDEAN